MTASPEHDEQHEHHDHRHDHDAGEPGGTGTSVAMAASATLHCLTGCAIGEIVGMLVSSAAGWSNAASVGVSFGLAFLFGYLLSSLPLLRAGLAIGHALQLVLAADTLSILTMEVVDNGLMALVPGALEAGLDDTLFWATMSVSLVAAFVAAFPVNRWLMDRGRGHALTHHTMHGHPADDDGGELQGWRRFVPDVPAPVLAAVIVAFVAGGAVASLAS